MKSIYALLLITFFSVNVFAQSEDENDKEKGFKKENLFTGGSLNLSFGSGQTALGISPFFGYSINKYLDVAVSGGYNYLSQKEYDYYGYSTGAKTRQSIYGPGAFVRIFPVKFLFAQAQYEYNIVKVKYIYPNDYNLPDEKYTYKASSMLIGAGYAGGREENNKSFYYLSIMWDVANSQYSPYKDYQNKAIPIIRAGYNIALFQNRDGGGQEVRRSRDRRDRF